MTSTKLGLLVLILFGSAVHACEVVDDLGRVVKLNHAAQRIISLAPDLTEDLFAIGAGKRILGVMQGSDYPGEAKKIPIVARYNMLDTEAILHARPDLIVAWADGVPVSQLDKWGIPVYFSRPQKLLDVASTLQKLGCLTGNEKIAQVVAANYVQQYSALSKKYSYKKPVSVFYQVWSSPLITITQQSWINEAITLCGGRNIFAHLYGVSPEVTIESIIAKNPDMIVAAYKDDHWKKFWQAWRSLRAVQEERLVSVDPDLLERAGPRLMQGVEGLCRGIKRSSVIR